jgi:hypothetical protein
VAALVVLHIDGRKLNGMLRRSGGSAAFVVSSPEPPQVQRKFAASRGWKSRTSNGWKPGISVFKRTGQKIVRVSEASVSPGDDFCTVYHLFDLLPGARPASEPRFCTSPASLRRREPQAVPTNAAANPALPGSGHPPRIAPHALAGQGVRGLDLRRSSSHAYDKP